jgi:hypothetical protein
MYDDDTVSSVNFTKTHKNQTMVQNRFTKTATCLFYVNPSIETRIKESQTIDLMEGGKEQAQNVPNSEINHCDGAGKEGHADGSSRDVVPIQSKSEGAKTKTVDICENGKEGTADGSSDTNDKKDDDEEEERVSGEVESSSGEESSSEAFVPPRTRHRRHRYQNRNIFSGSSDSSSDSSDSSSDS